MGNYGDMMHMDIIDIYVHVVHIPPTELVHQPFLQKYNISSHSIQQL